MKTAEAKSIARVASAASPPSFPETRNRRSAWGLGREHSVSRPQVGRRGFTLLEVLAAVAILGTWYVVIATSAMQGLRAEGESRRRLEASLLADSVIADFEAKVVTGSAPEVMAERHQEGDFDITIKVTLFAPFGQERFDDEKGRDLTSLVAGNLPGVAQHLRTISVQVAWIEGDAERAVYRTSYGLHVEKAADTLWGPDGDGIPRSEEDIRAELPTS